MLGCLFEVLFRTGLEKDGGVVLLSFMHPETNKFNNLIHQTRAAIWLSGYQPRNDAKNYKIPLERQQAIEREDSLSS